MLHCFLAQTRSYGALITLLDGDAIPYTPVGNKGSVLVIFYKKKSWHCVCMSYVKEYEE